jgi:2'-5' RNA ligase
LRFLGEITEEDAQKLYRFLEDDINHNIFAHGPLEGKIVGTGDFNKRVFYVDVQQLADVLIKINQQIETKLKEFPQIKHEDKSFTPHITIARAKDLHGSSSQKNRVNVGQKTYAELKQQYRSFEFGPWQLEKVVLKKSILTPKGPMYSNLSY